MKFTKIFLIISICIFSFLLGVAQNLKTEFVDSQKIFEKLPEAQEAKKKLDSLAKIWQDEMEKMSQDLQVQYEAYQSSLHMMSDVVKKAEVQHLMKLQERIQDFRVQKFGQSGELAMEQKKILTPIQEKVHEILNEQKKIR